MRRQAIFNELVQFMAPGGFSAAVTSAARRDHTSNAEFLRRAVIARLRELGLPPDPSGSAFSQKASVIDPAQECAKCGRTSEAAAP
jgi:hypothetical protein